MAAPPLSPAQEPLHTPRGRMPPCQSCSETPLPQRQAVHSTAVIAGDEHIIRHRHNGAVILLIYPVFPVSVESADSLAAEFHRNRVVGARDKPHAAVRKPVVREFHLPAADYLLPEYTELVFYRKTGAGDVKPRRRVHVAGSKPSELFRFQAPRRAQYR